MVGTEAIWTLFGGRLWLAAGSSAPKLRLERFEQGMPYISKFRRHCTQTVYGASGCGDFTLENVSCRHATNRVVDRAGKLSQLGFQTRKSTLYRGPDISRKGPLGVLQLPFNLGYT